MKRNKPFQGVSAIAKRASAPVVVAVAWCVLSLFVLPPPPSAAREDEAPAGGKKFAVVAPAEFHASLADFLAHKAKQLSWRDDRLGYALLVGDVDVMPVRYMVLDRVTPAAFDYAFYPSDLYYADLAKADGSFEIGVGRWPVSTARQAELVAWKTIRYERGLLSGDKPGRNRDI